MSEYIKREDAIERLTNLFQLQKETARAIIEAIPAADVVERKKGEWETIPFKCGSFMLYMPYCSICGAKPTEIGWKYRPNYCPNCGTRMEDKK